MNPGFFFFVTLMTVSVVTRAAPADAITTSQTQTAETFVKTVTHSVRLNYLLHLPADYKSDNGRKWPLLVFLHGSGEKGTNLALVTVHGPPKIVAGQPDFPFILVSPQCPLGQYGWADEDILALIDDFAKSHRVDRTRIYLTGLSMGGYGTWSLATSHPEVFAAVAPICGGGDPADVRWMKPQKPREFESIGVWAFHGAKDTVVPLSESQDMVKAFRDAGCQDIQLTVYPDAGHNSWTEAYNNPKLYEWMLQHRRD